MTSDTSKHSSRANQGGTDSRSSDVPANTGAPLRAATPGDDATVDRPVGGPASRSASASDAGQPPSDPQKTVISKQPPASLPAFARAATPFEMGRALEGQQLDHFQLEEFVGGGGMGAVFRATDTKLGRTVAVKVVSRSRTGDDALRRFRNEAQSAARLDHPNIARVYYVGEDKGWDYIVFEYIEGINVRDLVHQIGPLSFRDAISYTVQIAEALEHASQRDVIHRDIKPSNILIMASGRAKLVDMGLARLHHVESTSDDLTESGVTLGTFDYISPEQASDPRAADVRSDLYSLGCTLYFMLTGQPPFPDGTMLQKLLKHSSVEPPDPRVLRPDLPDELAQVMRRLLAKSPGQRFQQPRELIAELIVVADHLDISGIQALGSLWTTTELRRPPTLVRHLPWVVPTALLLVVVVVLQLTAKFETPATVPRPQVVNRAATPRSKNPATAASPSVAPAATAKPSTKKPEPPASPKLDAGPDVATPVDRGDPSAAMPDLSTDASATPSKKKPEAPSATPASDSQKPEMKSGSSSSPDEPSGAPGPAGSSDTKQTSPSSAADSTARSPRADSSTDNTSIDHAADSVLPVIVVSDEDVELPAPWQHASTVRQALQQAAESNVPLAIELRFNGPRRLAPMRLDLRHMPQQTLTIRAAEGFAPLLVFEPAAGTSNTPGPDAMIDVVGGRLTWIGLHIHLDFSTTTPNANAFRALFSLHDIDRIELRDCTLTISNRSNASSAGQRQVAFFEFPAVMTEPLPGTAEASLTNSTPTIWIERCVVRGQATLVRAPRAMAFLLFWEQGLFVSTERLVEMGGTVVQPRWEHGRATLFFQQLLAAADQGICRIKTDPDAPYSLGLAANCYDCLFVTKPNEPNVPLYEIYNVTSAANDSILLSVGGNNNYYKNTQQVLRIDANQPPRAVQSFTFEDLKKMGEVAWYHEKDPQPAVMFRWSPRTAPVDQQTLDDFRPAADQDGTLNRLLRISASALPHPMDDRGVSTWRRFDASQLQPSPPASPSSGIR